MKRTIIFILIFCAAAVCYAPQVFAQSAVIRELTGTVELQNAGATTWVAARAGQTIATSAIISTGFKSTAVLNVGSNTLFVQPVTRLSIQELATRDETEVVNIALNTGRVRVDVKPPAGTRASTTVQSPSSVASVRGTTFELDGFSITVQEGSVNFRPASADDTRTPRGVNVNKGQGTWINPDTGTALNPMVAEAVLRTLPALPGENQWSFGWRSGGGGSGSTGGDKYITGPSGFELPDIDLEY